MVTNEQKAFFNTLGSILYEVSQTSNRAVVFDYNVRDRLANFAVNLGMLGIANLLTYHDLEEKAGGHFVPGLKIGLKFDDLPTTPRMTRSMRMLPGYIIRTSDDAIDPDLLMEALSSNDLQQHISTTILSNLERSLPEITHVDMNPVANQSIQIAKKDIDLLRSGLGSTIQLHPFDQSKPLLEAFSKGQRSLSELGRDSIPFTWGPLELALPSERDLLFVAIEACLIYMAERKGFSVSQMEKLKERLGTSETQGTDPSQRQRRGKTLKELFYEACRAEDIAAGVDLSAEEDKTADVSVDELSSSPYLTPISDAPTPPMQDSDSSAVSADTSPSLPETPETTAPISPSPRAILGSRREWDEIRQRADAFVNERLQEDPPYHMFRCNLGIQPGHAVTMYLSRWVTGEDNVRRVETASDTILLNEPDLGRALDLKKQLQSYVFNRYDVIEHRRLHETHYVIAEDDFLPTSAPIARLHKRNGVYTLQLSFPDIHQESGQPITTITDIPLGVRQEGDVTIAETRRNRVLRYLADAQQDGRRMTSQDLRVWLMNEVHLQEERWEQAQHINLREHPEVERDILVGFPAGSTTRIHVGNPELEGTPNGFWRVPLEIYYGDEKIARPSVNTHIRDDSMLMLRIREITEHMQTYLELHAEQYPNATWQLNDRQRLQQLNADALRETDNLDWTRLDQMISELHYVRQLAVHISPPERTENNQLRFALAVRREDGSLFAQTPPGQHTTVPLVREFTITPGRDEQETTWILEAFRARIHSDFYTELTEAFSGARDPRFEADRPAPHRKALQKYDSRSIVQMFRGAVDSALDHFGSQISQFAGTRNYTADDFRDRLGQTRGVEAQRGA